MYQKEGTDYENIEKACQHNFSKSIFGAKEVKKRVISQYYTKWT